MADSTAVNVLLSLVPSDSTEDTPIDLMDAISASLAEIYGTKIGGLELPSAVTNRCTISPVNQFPYVQIIYALNHYVVIHALSGVNAVVYDSLPKHEDRMRYLEGIVSYSFKTVNHRSVFDQGSSATCGQYAAATAFFACKKGDQYLTIPSIPLVLKDPVETFASIIGNLETRRKDDILYPHSLWKVEEARRSRSSQPLDSVYTSGPPKPPSYLDLSGSAGRTRPVINDASRRTTKPRGSPQRTGFPSPPRRTESHHFLDAASTLITGATRGTVPLSNPGNSAPAVPPNLVVPPPSQARDRDVRPTRSSRRRPAPYATPTKVGTVSPPDVQPPPDILLPDHETAPPPQPDPPMGYPHPLPTLPDLTMDDASPKHPMDDDPPISPTADRRGYDFDYDPTNAHKRTIVALTSFLNFTVYNTVNYTLKRYYGIKALCPPLPKSADPPPILAGYRRTLNAYEYTRLRYRNNPPTRRIPGATIMETALQKKRDLQLTELIRQGIGKDAERFRTRVFNKFFYVQPVWIPPNVTWKTVQPKFVRRIVKRDGIEYVFDVHLIALNLANLSDVFSACFSVAVPQTGVEDHKYLTHTIKAINQMASTVNAVGLGKASPATLLLECLRAKYGCDKVNKVSWFFDWLEGFNFTSLDPETALDSDFGEIFDRTAVMRRINRGESLDFDDPRTALLIKDYFSDVALHILSEMVLLKLVWHVGIMSSTLRSIVTKKFHDAITRSECSAPLVCQWFPGIFTLICNWAKKYENHNLKFVSVLHNLSQKKYIRETYVRLQRSASYEITEIAMAVTDSFIGGFRLNDVSTPERRRKYRGQHIIRDSNAFVQDNKCHFLKTNSFV